MCLEEIFDSEDSALGVPFKRSPVVLNPCCSYWVCGGGREGHDESYILQRVASSRRGIIAIFEGV